jgi:hypothetical protein
MRFFRSRELTYWAVLLVGLGVLLAVAAHRGTAARAHHTALPGMLVPGPTNSAADSSVLQLVELMPAGVAAGSDSTALKSWASDVATVAGAGYATRRAEGAASSDSLAAGLYAVRGDADAVSEHSNGGVYAVSLRIHTGLQVTLLHQLVQGLPAVELPQAALDPFSGIAPALVTGPAVTAAPTQPGLPHQPVDPHSPAGSSLPGHITIPTQLSTPVLPTPEELQ